MQNMPRRILSVGSAISIVAALSCLSGTAFSETYYLTDDFGVQGKFRRCKYSNGKVYGVPASEPACYDSVESGAKPAPSQPQSLLQQNAPLPAVGGRAFRNCSEARAAGAAPVRRGDPGYSPKLDRDNDGIGCE